MKRELSYREEMVQQLHIVRGETNNSSAATSAGSHVCCRVLAGVTADISGYRQVLSASFTVFRFTLSDR